jgi:YesN/AraC family two-component response regulator
MIKVILADDHKIVRDGLKAMIQFSKGNIEVVGEAANGKEPIELLSRVEAHVVVMDIDMPLMSARYFFESRPVIPG